MSAAPGGGRLRYEVVDVFATRPFTGNPLAVVLDADELSDRAVLAIAREFNLSETAFLLSPTDPGATHRVRIATPDEELPFAGHPSIGAAWAAVRAGLLPAGELVQECRAGRYPVRVPADGGRVELTCGAPTAGEPLDPGPFLAAVGLELADATGPALVCSAGLPHVLVGVAPEAVGRAGPEPRALRGLVRALGASCLVPVAWDPATATAHVRAFDWSGAIGEDPGTGSAGAALAAWLVAEGMLDDGEHSYVVHQGAEAGRPSLLHGTVRVEGGRAVDCRIAGDVVPVAAGEIVVPKD